MSEKKYTNGMVLTTYFKTSKSGNKCLTLKCLLEDGRTYYRDLVLIEKMNDRNVKDVQAFTGTELEFVTADALKSVEFGTRSFTLVEMEGRDGSTLEFINERRGWVPREERPYTPGGNQTVQQASPF